MTEPQHSLLAPTALRIPAGQKPGIASPGKDAGPVDGDSATPHESLRTWEKLLLAGLLFATMLFGILVEYRSAFLSRRMGDAGVFFRAGWAVYTGADLYAITCDNLWHYNYPPLFAILMTPFADPPAGAEGTGLLPYPVSIGIWYLLSVLCLGLAVHGLAAALEKRAVNPQVRRQDWRSRRWWFLRVAPVLALLPPIGHTLGRGQVNLLLLLLVCGMITGLIRRRRFTAGLYLAGAICLKIIPALLLVYPLWRRDGRTLAGCFAGLLVGLLLIPLAILGPTRTSKGYQDLFQTLLGPALGLAGDGSRADEILNGSATNNQSFQAMIHHFQYPNPYTRPKEVSPLVRRVHWLVGGLMVVATLLAARWRSRPSPLSDLLAVGLLSIVFSLTSPVCHSHYFVLCLPALMGLILWQWDGSADAGKMARFLDLPVAGWWVAVAVVQLAGNILPLLPTGWSWRLRELGVAGYAAIILWAVGVGVLFRLSHAPTRTWSTLRSPDSSQAFALS